MNDARVACEEWVARCRAGEISVPIALMEMLLASEDVRVVEAVVARAGLPELSELFGRNREGCAQIELMLRTEPSLSAASSSVEDGLAVWRRLFDVLVGQSEEASVALYSLASPAILAAATEEIVALLQRWQVLTPQTRVLDFGCGIGRIAIAVAPHVARVDGIDLSAQMVSAATRRTAHLGNVRISVSDGKDLSSFSDRSHDLVLAVDSFPYVVKVGPDLTSSLFAEVARVLRAGGAFVLLNFSYRGDLALDAADVEALAARHDLHVEVSGERPFRLWNGDAFLLRASR